MPKKATRKRSKKSARKKAARRAIPKPELADSSESFSDSLVKLGNEKIAAILQYFFPIGLIWFLVDEKIKKSGLVKFHLKQSLVLVITYTIWRIICELLWFIVGPIGWIVQLGLVVLAVVGIINAYKGKKKEVPLLGSFSKHFKF